MTLGRIRAMGFLLAGRRRARPPRGGLRRRGQRAAAPAAACPRRAPAAPPAKPDAAAPAKPAAPAAKPAAASASEWRPGDVLEVKVLTRPDLSCAVRVVADGTIDVPFAGRYRVIGRSLDDVRVDVEAGFAKLERTPQVAITVSSLAPDEFYVLGEVGKAGGFTVPRTKHLNFLQALGMAGGFGTEADFTRVQIVPGAGGDPRTVDASPGRLASLAGLAIGDRDTIVVPPVGRIYLMGQVNRTGRLRAARRGAHDADEGDRARGRLHPARRHRRGARHLAGAERRADEHALQREGDPQRGHGGHRGLPRKPRLRARAATLTA